MTFEAIVLHVHLEGRRPSPFPGCDIDEVVNSVEGDSVGSASGSIGRGCDEWAEIEATE